MELTEDILIQPAPHSKIRDVQFDQLEWGKHVSDHMLIAHYYDGHWHKPKITPYTNLSLSPATLALHYGQTVFEGMKAFRMEDGRINIFRIYRHYERLVRSLERMCMAVVPRQIFVDGLRALIRTDRQWIPASSGHALYIRPFVIASESKFGMKVSEEYQFIVFTGPVPPVYSTPIKVKIEMKYIRAAKGGTGSAKCGGNYGGVFYPTQLARREGYDQVLWTDARYNRYIEESGMMNVMFVINNRLITPALSDSILDGITRECLLTLAAANGYQTDERAIDIEELAKAFRNKTITEAFGTGTAAVVAPIQTIHLNGKDHQLPEYSHDSISYKLKQQLEFIRTGRAPDIYNWNYTI